MTETSPQYAPAVAPRREVNQRDRALDLLRALATLRVFLWHATGAAALTFVGALPVMFWLNGMLFMRSVERTGVREVLSDRAKRLLVPYWFFGMCMLPLMAVRSRGEFDVVRSLLGWVVPIVNPVGAEWQHGWITEPLWYLRAYMWLLVLSPLLVLAARRSPVRALAVLGAGTLLLETGLGANAWALQDMFTYGFFFTLGLVTTGRGEPSAALRRISGLLAAVGAVSLWQVHAPLGGVVNNSHSIHLLVGIATLAGALESRGVLRRMAELRFVRGWVDRMRERSLTFYLWHAPITGLSWLVIGRVGFENRTVSGVLAVAVGFAVSFLVSGALCNIETVASGFRGYRRPHTRQLAVAAAGVIALTSGLIIPATGAAELPPTPSQAPEQADFAVSNTDSFLLASPVAVQSANTGSTTPAAAQDPHTTGTRYQPGTSNRPRTTPRTPGSKPSSTVVAAPTARGATPPVTAWPAIAPELESSKVAAVDAAVARWLAAKPTETVEIALLAPGRFRYNSGYQGDGTPTANAASIPLHSITKTFTAALLLRAVEDGKIRLEDRIGILEAAPWFTIAQDITLAQLLAHRSGLITYTDTRAHKADWRSTTSWEATLRAVQDDGLTFTPGTRQTYSSTNFIVAGLLAAQIYGLPIENLIERDLLNPLGLDRTTVGRPEPGAPGTGTGNMRAHITDVARWAVAMWRDKTVLGSTGNKLALYVDPVNMLGYGNFAYCPCRKSGNTTIPAAYGGNGAEATMRYYSNVDTVIVIRTPNGAPSGVEELITEVLRIVNS